jgi:hypothetical protein
MARALLLKIMVWKQRFGVSITLLTLFGKEFSPEKSAWKASTVTETALNCRSTLLASCVPARKIYA